MKKIIIIAALLLAASIQLNAVPAQRGAFIWTQPDGTKLTLYRHGDEFEHWTADANGNEYVLIDGWYRIGTSHNRRKPSLAAINRRQAVDRLRAEIRSNAATHGTHRIPVILVEFSDVKFSISDPKSAFNALLNQNGYTANGATGSVRDYYYENSHGEYTPVFDIYGPVTLSKPMKYYGENSNDEACSDLHPEEALYDALVLLDETVDFSPYDSDGDGRVDMTLFYYAGYNEAEHGPEDSIWPHQWSLLGSAAQDNTGYYYIRNNNFDGVRFANYFCTSELRSNSGTEMCGIGTTCHEFGHSLGLPDFYDTDYGKNGQSGALYWFSIMSSGAYNNNGRTPPYFNSEELIILDWMDESEVEVIEKAGEYTLATVEQKKAYRIMGETEGEYFILETRGGQGWDAPLPAGMLAYHVDKSKTRNVSINSNNYTPYDLWEHTNTINANGDHPCFYVVPAANQSSLYYSAGYLDDFLFPGRMGVTQYMPVDWDGKYTAQKLSSVSYSSSTHKTTFTVSVENQRHIDGTVVNLAGEPLKNVTVHVTPVDESSSIISHGSRKLVSIKAKSARAPYIIQTDANGQFTVDLRDCTTDKVEVCTYLDNYVPTSEIVTLKPLGNTMTITMLRVGESMPTDLFKYNTGGSLTAVGWGDTSVQAMFASKFSESDLTDYRGHLIKELSFYPNVTSGILYLIIDFGTTRVLTYQVPSPAYGDLITVNLESFNLHIPDSGDVYFGYGLKDYDNGYPYAVVSPGSYGVYYDDLNLTVSDWGYSDSFDLYLYVTVQKEYVDPGQTVHTIAEMGFSMIEIPENFSMTAGSVLPLNVLLGNGVNPSAIAWSMDGTSLTGSSVTLTSGTHTLCATLYYSDGSDETIEVELEVL